MASKLPEAVIDNTLLSRLTRLGIAEYLPFVFSKIYIPVEVREEAYKAANRKRLRNLLNEMSGFFALCKEDDFLNKEILKTLLDIGEASAIAQAEFLNTSIILDEKKGRKQAEQREIIVYPTLRILLLIKKSGFIPKVKPYLKKLKKSEFFIDDKLFDKVLKEAQEL